MDRRGQSALFDAFLFFVVALVASAAALGYALLSIAQDETSARGEAIAYTEDVRLTLMRTTLEESWYINDLGELVDLGQGVTFETFLLAETRLLSGGLPRQNFEHIEEAIRGTTESLLRPPFSGGIFAKLTGPGPTIHLWLGPGAAPPPERFTSAWTYSTSDGPVEIAVHLWYL